MRSEQNRGILVLTTCVVLTVLSTGCRSGKTGNLFSFRSEPSPEALAGNGPTTTYPVPPSEAATPQAIDSVAAGIGVSNGSPVTPPTGTSSPAAQVAGLNVTPGYIRPASTNMSAAQANGFHNASPAGFQRPTGAPSMDGVVPPVKAPKTSTPGYQFGTNPQAKAAGASSYTIPSSYKTPAAKSDAATPSAVTNAGGASGFTLPDMAGTVATAGGTSGACADCDGCAACNKGSAASPMPAITPPAPGGYSPGSTANAVDYPAPNSTFLR